MKILVTGTAGFIASHLALRLQARGHSVQGLDIRPPHPALAGMPHDRCDLLDAVRLRQCITSFAPEIVLHLAARTDLDETATIADYGANVEGVANIVAAIKETPSVRRAICTSTQLVYRLGERPKSDTEYAATTVYGRSKIETERIWRGSDGAGVEWALVRPTTIWGPRMNPHYLRFFRMIQNGWYFHVGREPTLKSYGYVGNTVHQYEMLTLAPADQIHRRTFYLADYEPISLQGWADAFQRALRAPPIRTMPIALASALARIGDLLNGVGVKRFPFNSFRLTNVLTPYPLDLAATYLVAGDLPYSLQDGVDATARWIREVESERHGLSAGSSAV